MDMNAAGWPGAPNSRRRLNSHCWAATSACALTMIVSSAVSPGPTVPRAFQILVRGAGSAARVGPGWQALGAGPAGNARPLPYIGPARLESRGGIPTGEFLGAL